jgi:NADPH-dependent glutamate synthase beta subunit-like oxidoreductase
MPTNEDSRFANRTPIPEEPAASRVQSFIEIHHAYSPEEAVLEAQRCLQCAMPYCVQACPIAQDARGYILLVAQRRFDEAAVVTLRENPLSTTLCKVCYHFCEDACIMHERGLPIAIRQLKRAAMELGNAKLAYVASAPKDRRVAVVGSGPAGLMAAWELGLRGYGVTVFEREPFLGGQVASIPKYHMDGYEFEVDVDRLKNLDVTFRLGQRLGADFTLDSLHADGYRAIYLALGAIGHRTLGVPGEDLPGVYYAVDLLTEENKGPPVSLGERVVVIGGGDVAMDAVRSARRFAADAKVTVVYRRTKADMPAGKEEVEEAEAEGVEFQFGLSPTAILGAGKVQSVGFRATELSKPRPSGRPAVVPVAGSDVTIACDAVIVAAGEKADLAGLPAELDLAFGKQGWPEGKGAGTMTGLPGIFASGGRSVVHAMAAGTKSAEGIDAYLQQLDGKPPIPRPDPFGGPNPPTRPAGYGAPTWTP